MPVFGVELDQIHESPPQVITDAVKALLRNDRYKKEGIFRLSGSTDEINKIAQQYDQGKTVDLDVHSVDNITGVIKKFLLDLKTPIIPTIHHTTIHKIIPSEKNDHCNAIGQLHDLLHQIPVKNQLILRPLFEILTKVVESAAVTKMTNDNLAMTLLPCIFGVHVMDDFGHVHLMAKALTLFIQYGLLWFTTTRTRLELMWTMKIVDSSSPAASSDVVQRLYQYVQKHFDSLGKIQQEMVSDHGLMVKRLLLSTDIHDAKSWSALSDLLSVLLSPDINVDEVVRCLKDLAKTQSNGILDVICGVITIAMEGKSDKTELKAIQKIVELLV